MKSKVKTTVPLKVRAVKHAPRTEAVQQLHIELAIHRESYNVCCLVEIAKYAHHLTAPGHRDVIAEAIEEAEGRCR